MVAWWLLPLHEWADDTSQDFDGPVQLYGHPAVTAQGFVVLGGGREVHDGHCSAVDGDCNGNVLSDPGGHGGLAVPPQSGSPGTGC